MKSGTPLHVLGEAFRCPNKKREEAARLLAHLCKHVVLFESSEVSPNDCLAVMQVKVYAVGGGTGAEYLAADARQVSVDPVSSRPMSSGAEAPNGE